MSAQQWAKRNAWALVAIPILTAGVFGAVALETDLRALFSQNGGSAPDVTVPAGETIELGGVEFGPVEFRLGSTITDGNQPAGTQVALAAIPVSEGKDGVSCRNLAVISESSDTVWLETTRELGIFELPSDVQSTCSTADPESAIIAGFFVVPEATSGPWAVELLVEQLSDESVTREIVRFETDASTAG